MSHMSPIGGECNDQKRVYDLLERLQSMSRELPANLQQRMSNELLSSLAQSLVQGQIFEIVRMLTEVQHAVEKKLFQDRLKLQKRLQEEKRAFDARYQKTVCEADAAADVLQLTADLEDEKTAMAASHAQEVKEFDSNLALRLDQKVEEQQSSLERAGVPGFYVTQNPTEQRVQMCLLKFIAEIDKNSNNGDVNKANRDTQNFQPRNKLK